MKISNFKKGVLFTATGSIGWGISGVCSQFLFSNYGFSPSFLTASRMFFSGIVLLVLSFLTGKNNLFDILKNKKDLLSLLCFAFCGLLFCQYTFFAAVNFSNSATATVMQSLNVVIMSLWISFTEKTAVTKKQILSLLLAISGTFLITTNGNISSLNISSKAVIFGICSAIGVVSYTLLSRNIIKKYGNILVTGWGMLIGGTVFGLATKSNYIPLNLNFQALIIVAVIILIGTALSFSLFLSGVKYIGPVKATLIGCLEPASATVLSAAVLKTSFGASEFIGFCAIIATVFLSVGKNKITPKQNIKICSTYK